MKIFLTKKEKYLNTNNKEKTKNGIENWFFTILKDEFIFFLFLKWV